jgi:hypothetical protein
MADVPIELQIKAFDLAIKWVEKTKHPMRRPTTAMIIDDKARRFDQAYKNIIKTLIEATKKQ